jgi:HSP20 family protein
MSSRDNPFEPVERMFEQMSRQFDDAARMWRRENAGSLESTRMGVDLKDEGDEFVATADVPGFERDDIDVRIAENTLSIDARREEQQTDEREGTYLRSERHHRSLSERVRFPEPVHEDSATATLRNGVLTVTVPKAEPRSEGGHQIEIE